MEADAVASCALSFHVLINDVCTCVNVVQYHRIHNPNSISAFGTVIVCVLSVAFSLFLTDMLSQVHSVQLNAASKSFGTKQNYKPNGIVACLNTSIL